MYVCKHIHKYLPVKPPAISTYPTPAPSPSPSDVAFLSLERVCARFAALGVYTLGAIALGPYLHEDTSLIVAAVEAETHFIPFWCPWHQAVRQPIPHSNHSRVHPYSDAGPLWRRMDTEQIKQQAGICAEAPCIAPWKVRDALMETPWAAGWCLQRLRASILPPRGCSHLVSVTSACFMPLV